MDIRVELLFRYHWFMCLMPLLETDRPLVRWACVSSSGNGHGSKVFDQACSPLESHLPDATNTVLCLLSLDICPRRYDCSPVPWAPYPTRQCRTRGGKGSGSAGSVGK